MAINPDKFSDKEVSDKIRAVIGGPELNPDEVKLWRRILRRARNGRDLRRYFMVNIPKTLKRNLN